MPYYPPIEKLVFDFRGVYGILQTEAYQSNIGGEISLIFPAEDEQFEWGLFVGLDRVEVGSAFDYFDSINKYAALFRGGVEILYHLPKEDRFLNPYFNFGMGGAVLGFQFKNPLTDGEEIINSDSIGGFYMSAGVGVSLVEFKYFRMGMLLRPELYIFEGSTMKGFTNDVFPAMSKVSILLTASIKIEE